MSDTLDLIDDRIYAGAFVCQNLGVTTSALEAARRRGELKAFKAGAGRYLYLGRWIRDWIESAATPEPEAAGVGG